MKFFDFIEEHKNDSLVFYFDMDGVLAEYDIGNFDYNTIRPLNSIIEIVKNLSKTYEVKILSICKTNKIVKEKIDWINKYMSFFDINNAILISKEEIKDKESSDLKFNYLVDNISKNNINVVIDDDNSIIKELKTIDGLKVFQISSLIK